MKRLILAASALSLALAGAPAFAADTTVPVTGSVGGKCGIGNQSGGGTGGGGTVAFGELTNANGFLDVAAKEIAFPNLWCNGPASYDFDISALQHKTITSGFDASSFVNKLDITLSGVVMNTYFGGGAIKTGDAGTGNVPGAFETGTGQYSKGQLALSLPTGTSGNDRPLAGLYEGTVKITLTAAP